MRLGLAACLVLLGAGPSISAPEPEPKVLVEFTETKTVPGQTLTLLLTVLVPTWMPKPPVLPSFDVPGLLVRLPERSTTPTSARVGDETWSGVVRRYEITPLVIGQLEIPPQSVRISFADPETRAPIEQTIRTEALKVTGIRPAGAENLDPLVAANDLTLDQEIIGMPSSMEPGEAVVRQVTVTAEGAPAMLLPPLLDGEKTDGLGVYTEQAIVHEERGSTVRATRTERVTYMAEHPGRFAVPAVELKWYDLDDRLLKSVSVPAFEIAVRGEATAVSADDDQSTPIWRLAALVSVLVVSVLVAARIWHAAPELLRPFRARRRQSEPYTYRLAIAALHEERVQESLARTDRWWHALGGQQREAPPALKTAMATVARRRYGPRDLSAEPDGTVWQRAIATLSAIRATEKVRRDDSLHTKLPKLNP